LVQAISASAIPLPTNLAVQRIDGKGRTLIPGLIDSARPRQDRVRGLGWGDRRALKRDGKAS
jgi:hypothetical protein